MGFVSLNDDSTIIPASYVIDNGDPAMPSFPSAQHILKQPLFTVTDLDPNATHNLNISIMDGRIPYSLSNFLVYGSSKVASKIGNKDDANGRLQSKPSSGSKISTIVAAVLAAVFFIILASVLLLLWWRRRKRMRKRNARSRVPSEHTSMSLSWLCLPLFS